MRWLRAKCAFEGAVSSSEAPPRASSGTASRSDLNTVGDLEFYVDGADEGDQHLHLIKGGGAALTREKIVAAGVAPLHLHRRRSQTGAGARAFPLPVEVIPMARSYVARELVRLGGDPVYREGVLTDNGNKILDVHDLKITDPVGLEQRSISIAGVVTNGLFARRPADVLIVARDSGVKTIKRK